MPLLLCIPFPAHGGALREEPIEEIIVRGGKRDTSLQDSDISVTILDATAIQQARLRDIRRLDDMAPNVQFNESGQMSSIFVTIRGVESNPFIVNRAAVYIDGIPFRELNNAVLNQVASIEVLRGPQSTLYGANSESGLILVNTKAPSQDSTAEVRVTGSNHPSGYGVEADGFLAGSILPDKLAGSVAFKLSQDDAYVKNDASSIGEAGEIRTLFLQTRQQWTPTENLTVNTIAYLLDISAPGVFTQEYVPLDIDRYNAAYKDSLNGGRTVGRFTSLNDAPKHTDEREVVLGMSATQDLGYGRLDGALSYRSEDSDSRGLDFDFTATPTVAGREVKEEEFWNAEIRFTSPDGEAFEYMVGAAAYRESENRILATFVGAGGLDSYIPAPRQSGSGEDYSLFASGSYHLDDWTLSAGLRYDHAYRKTHQQAGALDLGATGEIFYQDVDLDGAFDALLPRVSLRYQASEQLTLYASSARGYIPGGFNLTAAQSGIEDDNVLRYDSETLWSHEIGFKWRPGPDVRFAGAVFYITADNWQEIQVVTDDQGRAITSDFIGSQASIRSYGGELEGTYTPLDGLDITGNIGYVDSRYRDFQIDETSNLQGNRVKLVPSYDAFLAVRYEWAQGLYLRGELGMTGKMTLDERAQAVQPAVTTVGLQLGYERAAYALRLFGENLTNARRASGLAFENLAFGADGVHYAPLDSPRVIGIELEMRY